MLSDDARIRAELLEAAERAIRAIWDWDYLDWNALAPYVTGQVAALFRANLASQEDEEDPGPSRTLTSLAIDIHSFPEETEALVLAHYRWRERGTEGSESVVWVFILENGSWKASGIGRESDFQKKASDEEELDETGDDAITGASF